MKQLLLSVSILFISLCLFAQPEMQWYISLGENGNVAASVSSFSDNSLLIGTSVNYRDTVPLPNYQGNLDILLSKYSSNGLLIWSKVYGSSGIDNCRKVLVLPDNSFLACGCFDGNDGDFLGLNNDSTKDGWLAKFDSSGSIIWLETFQAMYFSSCNLCIDSLYNIYFLASGIYLSASNPQGMYDLVIFKVDSAGNKIWGKSYGGQKSDFGRSIVYLPDSTLVAVGTSASDDGHLPGNYGDLDAWFLKISTDGDVLESKIFGGSDVDNFYSVILLDSNSLLINGYTESNDVDISYLKGQSDILLVKTNLNGNVLWKKTYGKQYYWYNSLYSDLTNESDIIIPFFSSDGYRGIGFLRLDQNGDSVYFKEFTMTYGYDHLEVYFTSSFIDKNNEMYFIGASRLNAQYFSINDTASILVKFGDVNAIEEIANEVAYLQYQNGIIKFPFDEPIFLFCVDISGRQIALSYESEQLRPQNALASGIYVLRAIFEEGERSFKFVVRD